MKSAYELAMERLQKTSPSFSLTEEQKKELAEVDSIYRAKIAEKELFLKEQIREAQIEGKTEDVELRQVVDVQVNKETKQMPPKAAHALQQMLKG